MQSLQKNNCRRRSIWSRGGDNTFTNWPDAVDAEQPLAVDRGTQQQTAKDVGIHMLFCLTAFNYAFNDDYRVLH